MSKPPIDFDWLRRLHIEKGLQVVIMGEPSGVLAIDSHPGAFATELIRLAEIGQKLEIQTAEVVKRLDS